MSPVVQAIWRDNLGYDLIGADRVPEGLALVHEALEVFETNGARGYTVIPLADLCFGYLKLDRYAEARFFGEAALDAPGRGRNARPLPREEPALPPRRGLPSLGRPRLGQGLLRPARRLLPRVPEPPRVPRGLRLPERHQPPGDAVKARRAPRPGGRWRPSSASPCSAPGARRGRDRRPLAGRDALRGLPDDLRRDRPRRPPATPDGAQSVLALRIDAVGRPALGRARRGDPRRERQVERVDRVRRVDAGRLRRLHEVAGLLRGHPLRRADRGPDLDPGRVPRERRPLLLDEPAARRDAAAVRDLDEARRAGRQVGARSCARLVGGDLASRRRASRSSSSRTAQIRFDETVAFDLNDLVGSRGPTALPGAAALGVHVPRRSSATRRRTAACSSPSRTSSPQKQVVLSIAFPSDLHRPPVLGGLVADGVRTRRTTRSAGRGSRASVPAWIDTTGTLSTAISPVSGTPTFYWPEGRS